MSYQYRVCNTNIDLSGLNGCSTESTGWKTELNDYTTDLNGCSTHLADWCPELDDRNPELTGVSTQLTDCNTQI